MSTDFSVRPVGSPAVTPIARPLPDATRTAVQTELPPSQSVTQAAAAAPTATEQDLRAADLSRQIVIDRAASAIVYQVIDKRTSEVIRQFPEQSTLRRRAYARALDAASDQAKQAARHLTKTDRIV